MQGNCVRCGRKVRSGDNWLRAHLWASTAAFHWTCFTALMKEHGENGAEEARQGRRITATLPDAAHDDHGFGKQ
jgi:hypothetical protein